ncbi:MAG: Crp/Fnr family transcriptional regulator [Arenicella sp.]|nr:Crp/Fnr family transcriptional regulator [Arenicella sp.]
MLNLLKITTPAFLDLLPPAVADQIIAASVLMKYSNGQLIHTRGSLKPGLSIVHKGAAHVGVNGIDGTFVMVAALGPGECFGEFTLFTELPRTHDISSIGESHIYQLSQYKFDILYQRESSISKALLKTTLMRTHILLEMLDAIRRLPILERTAKVLLSMLYTLGGSNVLRGRQDELAYTLGVTRVSLGKALKELSRLGLIEIGYAKIAIPDHAQLSDWVELNCGT